MTLSEFATTTSDSASMTSYERVRTSISMSSLQRHQKHALFSSILYISRSQYINERWIYYITAAIREQMTWRVEEHEVNWFATQSIQFVFFAVVCSSSMRQYSVIDLSVSKSAVNQNASISKNSKDSNSKSLRQHTSAKSISLCCFCFCSRNRSFHHTNNQISSRTRFSTRFSFSTSSHIFFVFALLLLFSHLSLHLFRICSETFNFNHDQSRIYVLVNEFLRNVDR